MITQEALDLTLQRTALTALLYYPEITIDDPAYQLGNEVDWCTELLDPSDRELLRELVMRSIVDPSRYRKLLFSRLMELSAADAS